MLSSAPVLSKGLAWPMFALCLVLSVLTVRLSAAEAANAGTITGHVSNQQTGKELEGAIVTVPGTKWETATDQTGAFTLLGVPAGSYTLQVNYIGLDQASLSATVSAGQTTTLPVILTSKVYQLNAFKVSGQAEGSAEALTDQRNAPNVKSVEALDSFGDLPNYDVGNLLIRLAGVTGSTDLDGNITTVSIRGTATNLNMVTLDGNLMPSNLGSDRGYSLRSISGALFDKIEVIKAPTPDMGADSIGGAVNFVTANALNIADRSLTSYRLGVTWDPPFMTELPSTHAHSTHPVVSFSQQQVFDVLGGQRNLGISLNVFYSENVSGGFDPTITYGSAAGTPGYYAYAISSRDTFNNRKQFSGQLRLDYKVSPSMSVYIDAITNEDNQQFNRWYTAKASTSQTVATIGSNGQPTGTGAILPGYTSGITQVVGVTASNLQLNSTFNGTIDRQRYVDAGARNDFGRWHLEYDVAYAESHTNNGTGKRDGSAGGGVFTMSDPGIGWIANISSPLHPQFTQTTGKPVTDAASYGTGLLVQRNTQFDMDNLTAKGLVHYLLPVAWPSFLQAGVNYRRQQVQNTADSREWNYVGSAPLSSLVGDAIHLSYENVQGFGSLPFIDSATAVADIHNNPSNWAENLYYNASGQFTGANNVTEQVPAAYVEGQTKLGRLSIMTGIRMESTYDAGGAYLQAPVLSTTAARTANPIGSALADYDHYDRINGHYTNWFPGVYLTYKITKGLQARADLTNSIGRPTFSDLVPSATPNNTAETLTVNDASVKPQYSRNYDASLEYYFEPIGVLSAGYFRKDIRDYITTATTGTVASGANNGYNGDYAGYALISNVNGGTAQISGWEFNYQQQFTFLPPPFQGLSFNANYTILTTKGNYGSGPVLSNTQIVNFIPKEGNVSLGYKYRNFESRILVNYIGDYLNANSTNASLVRYTQNRSTTNLNLGYTISKGVTLFCDFNNLFNAPTRWYYTGSTGHRLEMGYIYYTTVSVGVRGKF